MVQIMPLLSFRRYAKMLREEEDMRASNTRRGMRQQSQSANCFLCSPEPEWTWAESPNFRAVLGLGPIGLGYTLIAARTHVPSMLDLDGGVVAELQAFTATVRARLENLFGPTVMTEHGRVAACVSSGARRHEPHCLHAHRLVFTGRTRVDLLKFAPFMRIRSFTDFPEAHRSVKWVGQYLYTENADGECSLGFVEGPLPRQFLRAVIARQAGRPELADWRSRPAIKEVWAARAALG